MKYYKVDFTLSCAEELLESACDVLAAEAGEIGFESFETSEGGLTGYIQQSLYDPSALEGLTEAFPLPDCSIIYKVSEADDRDWNEAWEQAGFEPIMVGQRCVVHDGRHLPDRASEISVEIDARQAFGTGTHETTRLMITALLDLTIEGKRMLDCGTGTGILSVVALKAGAASAVGYDIDEWSADNARHNAVINHVDDRFTPLLGDATLLDSIEGQFDVVMANINRNILLADMERFVKVMAPGGHLLLSGFYRDDVPLLKARAEELGLSVVEEMYEGEWGECGLRK